jgi:hypothetical protein
MRHTEDLPVRQVPKHRPPFPYTHEQFHFSLVLLISSLSLLYYLSRRRAIFPIFQQNIDLYAAPLRWRSFELIYTVEKISTPSLGIVLG